MVDRHGERMRTFASGATRDADDHKLDFEGFLSPFVLERYAQYMHKHQPPKRWDLARVR